MRIALVNANRRRLGGVETYLSVLVPALRTAGHEVALWYETDGPEERLLIAPAEEMPAWKIDGAGTSMAALRAWRPDVVYSQGLNDPAIEDDLLRVAPAVFYAHTYVGTCISGTKTWQLPTPRPCERVFGPACFAQYYPRHCGGWNPWTMVRQYSLQARRQEILGRCDSLLVASRHMAREFDRHGLGERVKVLELPVPDPGAGNEIRRPWPSETCELLFLGRMERLKGGQVLLESIPMIRSKLRSKLHVTFAGDGGAAAEWKLQAAQIQRQNPGVKITFTGWVDERQRKEWLGAAHLLIMPSVWPEPFGLAGVEAGYFGVPAVAFDVGGIASWLREGVNGLIANGSPPDARALSEAVIGCLRDSETYARFSRGAREGSARFSLAKHLAALLAHFEVVVAARKPSP